MLSTPPPLDTASTYTVTTRFCRGQEHCYGSCEWRMLHINRCNVDGNSGTIVVGDVVTGTGITGAQAALCE